MRRLFLVPVAMVSLAMQGQSGSSSSMARPRAVTILAAELKTRLDTKKSKIGDAVDLKTTRAATLQDGTRLPKGTWLVGRVNEVHATSAHDSTSDVVFALDRAVLEGGRIVPLWAAVSSATAPDDVLTKTFFTGQTEGLTGGGMAGAPAPPPHEALGSSAFQSNGPGRMAHFVNQRVPVANLVGVVLATSDGRTSSGRLFSTKRDFVVEKDTVMTVDAQPNRP